MVDIAKLNAQFDIWAAPRNHETQPSEKIYHSNFNGALMLADENGDDLSKAELLKIMPDMGLSEAESNVVFNNFDADKNNLLDIDEVNTIFSIGNKFNAQDGCWTKSELNLFVGEIVKPMATPYPVVPIPFEEPLTPDPSPPNPPTYNSADPADDVRSTSTSTVKAREEAVSKAFDSLNGKTPGDVLISNVDMTKALNKAEIGTKDQALTLPELTKLAKSFGLDVESTDVKAKLDQFFQSYARDGNISFSDIKEVFSEFADDNGMIDAGGFANLVSDLGGSPSTSAAFATANSDGSRDNIVDATDIETMLDKVNADSHIITKEEFAAFASDLGISSADRRDVDKVYDFIKGTGTEVTKDKIIAYVMKFDTGNNGIDATEFGKLTAELQAGPSAFKLLSGGDTKITAARFDALFDEANTKGLKGNYASLDHDEFQAFADKLGINALNDNAYETFAGGAQNHKMTKDEFFKKFADLLGTIPTGGGPATWTEADFSAILICLDEAPSDETMALAATAPAIIALAKANGLISTNTATTIGEATYTTTKPNQSPKTTLVNVPPLTKTIKVDLKDEDSPFQHGSFTYSYDPAKLTYAPGELFESFPGYFGPQPPVGQEAHKYTFTMTMLDSSGAVLEVSKNSKYTKATDGPDGPVYTHYKANPVT